MKLSSPKTGINALAAEISLVLDEVVAELILTHHIQGVLNSEADSLGTLSQGASTTASLVSATCLPVPSKMMRFMALGTGRMSRTCTKHCCVFVLFTG